MGLLSRIFGPQTVKAAEGASSPGPHYLPITGGTLSADAGRYLNWWQMGYDVSSGSGCSAMVEACVSAYAQTIAMCPGGHWRRAGHGGRERVSNSALARVLKQPNDYQSISDFLLNLVRDLYLDGNSYALAQRNDRYEIVELHPMQARRCSPQLSEDGDVFFHLGGNEIVERQLGQALIVPARDVLNIRLHTPRNPLKGESPLRAAAIDVAMTDAMSRQQLAFYLNQARPGFILGTDQLLTADQTKQIRERWNEQSQGMASGGTPILSAGLKPYPLSVSAENAQLAEIMKMSAQHIALTFRVPLQILGMGTAAVTSTEALMQSWIASGLGFALNHIEEAFGNLFGLKGQPDEYLEFDTSALLRSSFQQRIEGLARGVQGGIYAPNEARALEDLKAVPFGDEPRVQQQVVPLSAASAIPAAPAAPPAPPAPPAPSAPASDRDATRASLQLILMGAATDSERRFDRTPAL